MMKEPAHGLAQSRDRRAQRGAGIELGPAKEKPGTIVRQQRDSSMQCHVRTSADFCNGLEQLTCLGEVRPCQ
jgi:hypothetical protein